MTEPQRRSRFRQQFSSARSSGQLAEVIESAEAGLNRSGEWQAAGLALTDIGLGVQGRHFLETAQTLHPLSAEAELVLGECCLQAGEADLAKLMIRNAGSRNGASCAIRLRSAEFLGDLDSPQCAWIICRRAVHEFPDEAQAWFLLSYFMGQIGCPFSRIEIAAQHAISLAPDVVSYRVSFASTLLKAGRPQQAWRLIRSFEESQLRQISCQCCIERLMSIFDGVQDVRRVLLCRKQLARLQEKAPLPKTEPDRATGEVA